MSKGSWQGYPHKTLLSPELIPTIINLGAYVFIPFCCQQGETGTSTWTKTHPRGAYTSCRQSLGKHTCTMGSLSKVDDSRPIANAPLCQACQHLSQLSWATPWVKAESPVLLGHLAKCHWEGFCPFLKTFSNNWEKCIVQMCPRIACWIFICLNHLWS